MKYLVVEDFSGQEVPFIFPDNVDHADMRDQLPYAKSIACGTVECVNGEFVCCGGNAEMGLKARPKDDAELIRHAFSPAGL